MPPSLGLDPRFLYKLNVFHWHLTDDEGWRLEVRALPNLTRLGAWRGRDEHMEPQLSGGWRTYGGFYSQEGRKQGGCRLPPHRETERHTETRRDTERHGETWRDTDRHRDTERQRDTQRNPQRRPETPTDLH